MKFFHNIWQIIICFNFIFEKIANIIYCIYYTIIKYYYYIASLLKRNEHYNYSRNYRKSIKNRENSIKRYIKKGLFVISILVLWYYFISFSFDSRGLWAKVLCSIGFLGLGWSIILWTYNIFRRNFWRLLLFMAVSLGGVFMYGYYDSCRKSEKCKNISFVIESVNDMNNAISSFFPSRGDTKIEELEENLDLGNSQDSSEEILLRQKKSKEADSQVNYNTWFMNPIFWYVLFHSSAYLAFGIMTISLWGRRLVNYLQCMMALDKDKYVFWGQELDERCLILGQDIYNNRVYSEIIISLFDDRIANYIDEYRLYDTLNRKKLFLQIYDANSFPFNSLFAPHHFFISNDETWNIKGCMTLLEKRKQYKINDEVHIYIRLGEGEKCMIYEGVLNALSQKALENNVNLHIFNESELIARDFINSFPTLLAPSIKKYINDKSARLYQQAKLHILMLGFGWQGRQLLSHIVENSQFLMEGRSAFKSPLIVDIVDKSEEAFSQYRKLREDACTQYNLFFSKIDIFSENFIQWLNNDNKLLKYDRIIISLGNDAINLEGFVLMHKLQLIKGAKQNLEIFVKQNYSLLEYFSNEELAKIKDIDEIKKFKKGVFGTLSSIYTNDMILDENIDKMAKFLHAIYYFMNKRTEMKQKIEKIKQYLDRVYDNNDKHRKKRIGEIVKQKWQTATLYNKRSSRAQAEGVKNLLLLLGYEISHKQISVNIINRLNDRINEDEELIKVLSENEHLRWMASMLMQGVKPWIITDNMILDNGEKNNLKPNQVKNHYRHGCLVDFKDILYVDRILNRLKGKEELDFIIPSPSQEFDFNVYLIPQILKTGEIYIQELK